MIPHDLIYHRPETVAEAVEAWGSSSGSHYLAGGTEILTRARERRVRPEAVIDLLGIAELAESREEDGNLLFGATLRLADLAEQSAFPLLAEACRHIADHSVRNTITLGGNVVGKLPYREAILPFLVVDSTAHLAGSEGARAVPLSKIFSKRLLLAEGELLTGLSVPLSGAKAPYFYRRCTRDSRVDYPLLTLCATPSKTGLVCALGGYAGYPLCFHTGASAELPAPAISDMRGSAGYRTALLQAALSDANQELPR